jgi:hypothetical protein
VSLILEALRKLDRERDAPQRGVLVLATVTAPDRRPRRLFVGLVALAGVVALAVAGLVLRGARPAQPPAAAAGSTLSPPAIEGDETRAVESVAGAALSPRIEPPATTARAKAHPPSVEPRPPVTTHRAEGAGPEPARPHPEARPPASSPAREAADAPAAQPSPETLVLEAIAERDGGRIAVLSGRLVREGDVLGATRVVRIGASEVEVETAGVRRVLHF